MKTTNRVKLFSLLMALTFFFSSYAQERDISGEIEKPLTSSIPSDPNVRIGKLKNGLTYYIRKNAKPEDKIEFRLAVNAGSILEKSHYWLAAIGVAAITLQTQAMAMPHEANLPLLYRALNAVNNSVFYRKAC